MTRTTLRRPMSFALAMIAALVGAFTSSARAATESAGASSAAPSLPLDPQGDSWSPWARKPGDGRFDRIPIDQRIYRGPTLPDDHPLRAEQNAKSARRWAREEKRRFGILLAKGRATGVCPCQTETEDIGPGHLAACPWSDPDYLPAGTWPSGEAT